MSEVDHKNILVLAEAHKKLRADYNNLETVLQETQNAVATLRVELQQIRSQTGLLLASTRGGGPTSGNKRQLGH